MVANLEVNAAWLATYLHLACFDFARLYPATARQESNLDDYLSLLVLDTGQELQAVDVYHILPPSDQACCRKNQLGMGGFAEPTIDRGRRRLIVTHPVRNALL
jgi:hypothetical protein